MQATTDSPRYGIPSQARSALQEAASLCFPQGSPAGAGHQSPGDIPQLGFDEGLFFIWAQALLPRKQRVAIIKATIQFIWVFRFIEPLFNKYTREALQDPLLGFILMKIGIGEYK